MSWLAALSGDALPWLLEVDPENPGPRYFALQDLLDRPEDDPEVRAARSAVMAAGPVPAILDAQYPAGYWIKPGNYYSPAYRGTVWQIMFLADLGADPADERVRRGCEYVLEHGIAANGAFSQTQPPVPSGCVHCISGGLLRALLCLGYAGDPRLQGVLDWQIQAITGEGQVRYYKSGTTGPGFACAFNLAQPCAWGAVRAMRALAAVPPERRSPAVRRAIQAGVEFLLSRDPAVADYPCTERVSSAWFKFGFPRGYTSDVLETVTALGELGYGADRRLAHALQFILSKQDAQGRWKLESGLNGKLWADVEHKGKPSKWVTLRARAALKRAVEAGDPPEQKIR